MKKTITCLLAMMFLTGCSCSPQGSTTSPSPGATTSTSPSSSPMVNEATLSGQELLDYLAEEYTLMDPSAIENLDANAMEGYTFGLNNQSYYLIRLDPTNAQAAAWLNDLSTSGQIDVKMDGLSKTMYGLINGNFVLLSDSNEYAEGFQQYYDAFSGQQALPGTQMTPSTSPSSSSGSNS